MLLPFFRNRLTKGQILIALLATSISCGQGTAFAQEKSKKNGLIESIQNLIKINNTKNRSIENKIKSQPEVISSLSDLKEVKLNPSNVRNILFYSDARFSSLIDQDECRFLMLLETGLIKNGPVEQGTVIVDYLSKENKPTSAIVTLKDYLDYKYNIGCSTNKDIRELFKADRWVKSYQSIPFKSPKNIDECKSELSTIVSNPYFPYVMSIAKTINEFETGADKNKKISRASSSIRFQYQDIIKNLDAFNLNLLRNLYNNFDDIGSFCKPYIAQDVWTKSFNGEKPLYILQKRCEMVSGKSNLTRDQLQACVNSLNKKKELCSKADGKGQALFPSETCDKISDSLKESRLFADYFDCPSNVENLSLINGARVLKHLDPTSEKTYGMCSGQTFKNLYELYEKAKHTDLWKFQICYNDRADNHEICLPYIPGIVPESPIEEGKVLALALSKVNGTSEKEICKIVDKLKYNPGLLEFSTGCFVIADTNFCTPEKCDRTILFDKKKIENVKYKGDLNFDYFPNNFIEEQYSLVNMISESTKKKGKIIRSLTDLEVYFKEYKDAIVHGVGCAEDLYPEYFKKYTLNQCTPLPFIISGFQMVKGEKRIVFHSSIEELHSPRMQIWNLVFNAVANFRLLHPLNTWALYGIK